MLHGVAAADRARLAGRVAVSATVMEEVMEGVSLKTVMEHVHPNAVVIGEATQLNLNRGGRGRAEIQLETIGRPAHSSSPQLGVNAVQDMLRVVAGVEQLTLGVDPVLGPAIMALTDIISDPYPAIPSSPAAAARHIGRTSLHG